QIELQTSARRLRTWLLGLFAVLALLLSTIGIYGVISYTTVRRTQEVGIRIALGAGTSSILSMILRQGLTMASAGLAVGMIAALALTHLISGLFWGVYAHRSAHTRCRCSDLAGGCCGRRIVSGSASNSR